MPATLCVVCLLLAQPGVEFEPDPQPPAFRSSPKEAKGLKPPAARPGEFSPSKTGDSEPKTILRPSARRAAPAFVPEESEDESNDFQAPPSLPKKKAAPPAATFDLSDDTPLTPPPPPRKTISVESKAFVQPAGQNDAKKTAAALLVKRAAESASDNAPQGRPLTLLTALERTGDRVAMLKIVKGYWLLNAALGERQFATREAEFLAGLSASGTPHEQAALAAARSAAAAHLAKAELSLTAAQQDLADATHSPPESPLPLPADLPLVGVYRTSFKELFANRPAPAALRRIDRTLPKLHELIEAQAAAVSDAEQWLEALDAATNQSLSDTLEAHAQVRRQRREFLVAVRDYNLWIAEYALAVANPSATRGALVATLIDTAAQPSPTKSVLVTPQRDVQPASARVPLGKSEFDSLTPVPANQPPSLSAPVSREIVPVTPP